MVTIVSPKENSLKKTLIGSNPKNDDNGEKEGKKGKIWGHIL
jgi:hypothetical protein